MGGRHHDHEPGACGERRCQQYEALAIAGAGDPAVHRVLEFFAATIRNKNTRMADRGGPASRP
jgi:hypothetical protein